MKLLLAVAFCALFSVPGQPRMNPRHRRSTHRNSVNIGRSLVS